MENKYISLKDACEYSNKSLSTIRRIVKGTPKNKLKYENLKNGSKKILIEVDYLNEYFDLKPKTSSSNKDNLTQSVNNSSEQLLIKTFENIIKTLNNELEAKNKQIDSIIEANSKQVQSLIERQRESNVIIERLNQIKSLETKEINEVRRKWWQRKK